MDLEYHVSANGFCEKNLINGIFSTILIHSRAGNINDLPILTEIIRGWSYSKFLVGLWLLQSNLAFGHHKKVP